MAERWPRSTMITLPSLREQGPGSLSFWLFESWAFRRTIYSDSVPFFPCRVCFNSKKSHTQVQSNSCVHTFQAGAHLDCRSCRWSRGGTCIYWVPRSRHACSRADKELIKGGSKREDTDQCNALEDNLCKIRMTKHLIPLLLDLAANDQFTACHS